MQQQAVVDMKGKLYYTVYDLGNLGSGPPLRCKDIDWGTVISNYCCSYPWQYNNYCFPAATFTEIYCPIVVFGKTLLNGWEVRFKCF